MPAPLSGPTLQHLAVAAQLEQLREVTGLTREAVAAKSEQLAQRTGGSGMSGSKVRRIELAEGRLAWKDVELLLRCYRADDETVARFKQQVDEARQPGWWHQWREAMPEWLHATIARETHASLIRTWDWVVPQELRTPDYERDLLQARLEPPEEELIGQRVTLLRERQRRILAGPCRLWAVMDASALQRPVGSAEVMRAQIAYLREVGARTDVTIQIAPMVAGPHLGLPPLRLLRTDAAGFPDITVQFLGGDQAQVSDREDMVKQHLGDLDAASVISSKPHMLHQHLEGIWT
jgi:uncharacterized protein DUF5753/helix-turn-helix protein